MGERELLHLSINSNIRRDYGAVQVRDANRRAEDDGRCAPARIRRWRYQRSRYVARERAR